MKKLWVFLLILILGIGMIELVGERRYQTKVFKQNLGTPNKIGEFHIGHIHYIPPGETEYQDVDFTYAEYSNRWELTKASYNLIVYKRFNAPNPFRWINRFEGANHQINYEPYALVWVDMTDPLNESSWHVIGTAQNVQGAINGTRIVWADAFGTDLDFILEKRRSGFKKLVRINNLAALGTRPSSNHEIVALFKYTGNGLKVRANGASQDWDELSYYESMSGFKISEITDDSKQSFILPSFVYGTPAIDEDIQVAPIKIFCAYRQNALWQAKVIPYSFLQSATFPILADTQSTFYADTGGDGTCAIDDVATWAAARDGAGQYHGDTSTNGSLTKVRRKNAASWYVWRSLFPFPTGDTIGASEPINSVTFSLKGDGTASSQTLPTDAGVNVVRGNQADPTDLVDGDFDAVDDNPPSSPMSQELCDSRILVASWNTSAYNDFPFNTNGKNFVANTGRGSGNYTKLAICGGYDIDDTESGSNGYDIVYGYFADQTGTGDDPKLVVDWGAGGTEYIYAGDVPLALIPDEPKGIMDLIYGGAISLGILPGYSSILDRVYSGNIPLSLLPGYSSILEMVYGGDVPVAIMPDFPAAILEKSYAGAISLSILPDAPIALLEKSYSGDIALIFTPNSTYSLVGAGEFIYAGNIPMIVLPSYASILDRTYAGNIPLSVLPSYSSILDRIYSGDISLILLPGYSSILDRAYSGDIPLVILPDYPKALLEKSYNGAIDIVLTPNSSYLLVEAMLEYIYGGDISLSLFPNSQYIKVIGPGAIPPQPSVEKEDLLLLAKDKAPVLIGKKGIILISEDN